MKRRCTITAATAVLVFTFLFAGCGPFADKGDETRMASEAGTQTSTAAATTSAVSSAEEGTTQSGPPQVITYYELNKLKLVASENFTAGFDIKLPKIVSDKPGALQINAEINEMKINIENYANTAGDLTGFEEILKYSYETSVKGNVVFVSLNTAHGYMASEYIADNFYYAYNYMTDTIATKTEIGQLFGLNETQILNMVNAGLASKGAQAVTGYDKIDLFVNAGGKLAADAKVESEMGGFYSEIIVLT